MTSQTTGDQGRDQPPRERQRAGDGRGRQKQAGARPAHPAGLRQGAQETPQDSREEDQGGRT